MADLLPTALRTPTLRMMERALPASLAKARIALRAMSAKAEADRDLTAQAGRMAELEQALCKERRKSAQLQESSAAAGGEVGLLGSTYPITSNKWKFIKHIGIHQHVCS